MNAENSPVTTLLQLVENVSSQTRDDAETIQVMSRILSRHRFVLAGDESRSALFERRLASLPATH